MLLLFYYLIVSVFILLIITPKNKLQVWIYTVAALIPANFFFIAYHLGEHGYSMYSLGDAIGWAILPNIVCIILLFIGFNRKLKNPTKYKISKLTYLLIAVVLGIGLYQDYQKKEIKKKMEEFRELFETNNSGVEKSSSVPAVEDDALYTMAIYNIHSEIVRGFNLPEHIIGDLYLVDVEFNEDAKTLLFVLNENGIARNDYTDYQFSAIEDAALDMFNSLLYELKGEPNLIYLEASLKMIINDKNDDRIFEKTKPISKQ